MLSLLSFLVMGLIAGWLANAFDGSRGGLLGSLLIGLAGSVVGGYIAGLIGFEVQGFWVGLMVATLGASALLLVSSFFRRRLT